MKKIGIFAVAAVAIAALTYAFSGATAAEPTTKSGPQAGEKVPGPFHPLNVTGDSPGEKVCLFCQNGENPVAMIFARENTPEIAKLIKKIDQATVAHADAKMGSFVVFLSDSKSMEKELKSLATQEKLTKCVLSIDNVAGPAKYKVAADADVTVVLYKERVVKANYAFKKGELKDSDIDKIVGDVQLIVK